MIFITGYVAERCDRAWRNDEEELDMLKLDDRWYDVLKWCCMLMLPALAVLVKTICTIWSLPLGTEISTTIMAVNAFLSAILGISTLQYNKDQS